jgi:hypothetical protein
MGADDDRDCVEHLWVLQGVTLTMAGAQADYECSRCGAVSVVTGDQMTGRVP